MTPDQDLRTPARRLIALRIEHANVDAAIAQMSEAPAHDALAVQRLKKRRLQLRNLINRLEAELDPDQPA